MALTTIARVRSLSGLRAKYVLGDALGTGNGVNTVFVPHQFSFFTSPTVDAPQVSEMKVYVSGVQVGIASVTENAVVLSVAPINGAQVTADYWGSNLANSEVTAFITEADAQIVGMLSGVYAITDLDDAPVVSKISAYLAAAAMLDEGFITVNPSVGSFPPDRLRRVANDLLAQISSGALTLVKADGSALVALVENWIAKSNYAEKDRLFEQDPFEVDYWGNPIVETTRTPFYWNDEDWPYP